MKKLLIVTDFFLPHKSGITTHIQNLTSVLKKNKFDITVLTCDHQGTLKQIEYIDNIRILRSKCSFSLNRGHYSFDLVKKFKQESKKADYINIHYPITEIFPLIFLSKKPIYLNYHCLPNSNSLILKFIHFYFYFFGIISIFLSKKIIVFSKDYFYSFFLHNIFKKNIIEIFPFVENISKTNKKIINNLNNKIINIGFLGRLSEEKGLKDLIKASEILINNKIEHLIKIAGDLEDKRFKKYINDLIQLSANNNCIEFIGKLKENEKSDFFNSIDVLVLPSTNSFEAFGLVQLEAMSFGKPVIASNLSGVRVPIKYTGNGLLFQKGNVDDLVKCIMCFQKWVKTINKESIIDSYNKYFNKEKFSNDYLSLFN